MLTVESLALPGVLAITPRIVGDDRGRFFETWRQDRYAEAGVRGPFVQDNISVSARETLRGLHFQHPNAQGKLISALSGRVFDVVVDIRQGSLNFGKWVGLELSADNGQQIWVPPGFAHGFAVLSKEATLHYKCSAYYAPESERVIRWSDPTLAIAWPITNPTLSERDASAPLLADIPLSALPTIDIAND